MFKSPKKVAILTPNVTILPILTNYYGFFLSKIPQICQKLIFWSKSCKSFNKKHYFYKKYRLITL